MSEEYIQHVTLSSGHVTGQRREDISDAALAAVSEMLDGLLQGAHVAVPGQPGYLANGSHYGRDLIVTLWAGPWATRVPILTTGVALKSRSAPGFWRELHAHPETLPLPLTTDPTTPPPPPWIADRIEIGAIRHPEALAWTGDWSRCLGWAWVEYAR